MQAYCMKCRTKREIKDPKAITMKNGRPATQGTCPVCGTKIFRIGKSSGQISFLATLRDKRLTNVRAAISLTRKKL